MLVTQNYWDLKVLKGEKMRKSFQILDNDFVTVWILLTEYLPWDST